MKILLLTNKFPYPEKDGYAIAVMGMMRSLAKAGHELTLLAINTKKHYYDVRKVPEKVQKLAEIYAVELNTDYSFIDILANLLLSSEPIHVKRFYTAGYEKVLIDLLKKTDFDVVQLEGLYLTAYVPAIRANSKAAVVLRAHNLEHEIWHRMAEGEKRYFQKIYLTELANRIEEYEWGHLLGGTYNGIVPISSRDNALMAAMAKKRKKKLPPMLTSTYGIDPSEIKDFALKPEYPSVFFLGALDWLPNQEGVRWFVDNVWGELHARYPEVKFYVAGRKMPVNFLSDKDTASGVIKVGEVEDAQKFMQEKGIMVAPLLSGSGIRIKIIEGMMMGKPIVASDVALEGNSAQHIHHIYRANSPAEFLEGVSLLIEKEGYGVALGKQAKAFATVAFDEKTITDKLVGFYSSLKK